MDRLVSLELLDLHCNMVACDVHRAKLWRGMMERKTEGHGHLHARRGAASGLPTARARHRENVQLGVNRRLLIIGGLTTTEPLTLTSVKKQKRYKKLQKLEKLSAHGPSVIRTRKAEMRADRVVTAASQNHHYHQPGNGI
ncbi:hypothetical protein niasHT_017996 [Heterodera trifolii]|uniref:Uncharacterized protein n=1 Tax=Heterodera trifolii TaxID=157864 RepID=A0ABD2LDY9_9BILA